MTYNFTPTIFFSLFADLDLDDLEQLGQGKLSACRLKCLNLSKNKVAGP